MDTEVLPPRVAKIKYPQDSRPPQQIIPKSINTVTTSRSFNDIPEEVRASSPPAARIPLPLPQSPTQVTNLNNGVHNPPARPVRPEDDTMLYNSRPSMESNRSQHPEEVDRAMTPTNRQQQHRRTESQSIHDHDNIAASPISSLASLRQVSNRIVSPSIGNSPSSRHRRINSDSPSEIAMNNNSRRVSNTNGFTPNAASFELLRARDEEIAALKAKQDWMRVTLALATSRGFVATPSAADDAVEDAKESDLEELHAVVKDEGGENGKVVEALIQMKQELARSKVDNSSLLLPYISGRV